MVLKKCSKCVVYTLKSQKLSEARVVHYQDTVIIYFKETNLKEAKIKAKVNFYDETSGVIRTLCLLTIRRNPAFPRFPEPLMAECTILDVNDVVQRQKDIRAKVHIETDFYSSARGHFYGTIHNISAGGIYMVTRQILDPNEMIGFDYRFRSLMRHFDIIALRAKKELGGRYGYGCRFVNLTDGADAAIRSYVFKTLQKKPFDE